MHPTTRRIPTILNASRGTGTCRARQVRRLRLVYGRLIRLVAVAHDKGIQHDIHLHLESRDVLAATPDRIFHAINEDIVAFLRAHQAIAGVKPAVLAPQVMTLLKTDPDQARQPASPPRAHRAGLRHPALAATCPRA